MGRKLVTICFWQNNDFLREFFNRPKLVPAAGRGVQSLQILLSFPKISVPWCFEQVSRRTSIFSEHPFSTVKVANVHFSFYCHANRSKSSMRRPLSNCRSLARWVWAVAAFKSKIMTGGRFPVIGGRFRCTNKFSDKSLWPCSEPKVGFFATRRTIFHPVLAFVYVSGICQPIFSGIWAKKLTGDFL